MVKYKNHLSYVAFPEQFPTYTMDICIHSMQHIIDNLFWKSKVRQTFVQIKPSTSPHVIKKIAIVNGIVL